MFSNFSKKADRTLPIVIIIGIILQFGFLYYNIFRYSNFLISVKLPYDLHINIFITNVVTTNNSQLMPTTQNTKYVYTIVSKTVQMNCKQLNFIIIGVKAMKHFFSNTYHNDDLRNIIHTQCINIVTNFSVNHWKFSLIGYNRRITVLENRIRN